MIIQFIYTETDVPGPFKKEGGFKFKCVVIPRSFQLGEPNDSQLIGGSETLLNSALPDFAGYRAPSVGVFTSDEEFSELPKEYVFSHLSAGHYAFGRLFTCGVNHGRPGTPFHQGFVVDSAGSKQLQDYLNRTSNHLHTRPIDFAFATPWMNARGEDEVNAALIDSDSFPKIGLQAADLSKLHHDVYDDHPKSKEILSQFAQAIYEAKDIHLPTDLHPNFSNWVSLLTHLIPQSVAWRLPFNSMNGEPVGSPNGFPQIVLSDKEIQPLSTEVRAWVDVVDYILTNSLDTELTSKIDELVGVFYAGGANSDNSYKFHPALAITLLAFLILDDAMVLGSDADEVVDRALNSLLALGVPPYFESEQTKRLFESSLSEGDRILHHATQWEYFLKLIEGLPVRDQEGL